MHRHKMVLWLSSNKVRKKHCSGDIYALLHTSLNVINKINPFSKIQCLNCSPALDNKTRNLTIGRELENGSDIFIATTKSSGLKLIEEISC